MTFGKVSSGSGFGLVFEEAWSDTGMVSVDFPMKYDAFAGLNSDELRPSNDWELDGGRKCLGCGVVPALYSHPHMLSNERFSSMTTMMCFT